MPMADRLFSDAEVILAKTGAFYGPETALTHGVTQEDRDILETRFPGLRAVFDRVRGRRPRPGQELRKQRNQSIVAALNNGTSLTEVAARYGLTKQTLSLVYRRTTGRTARPYPWSTPRRLFAGRDLEIVARIEAGETLHAIGTSLGLSRARISQIWHAAGKGHVPSEAVRHPIYCTDCGTLLVGSRRYAKTPRCAACFQVTRDKLWTTHLCEVCGKEFRVRLKTLRSEERPKLRITGRFCSRKCLGRYMGLHYGFAAHEQNRKWPLALHQEMLAALQSQGTWSTPCTGAEHGPKSACRLTSSCQSFARYHGMRTSGRHKNGLLVLQAVDAKPMRG